MITKYIKNKYKKEGYNKGFTDGKAQNLSKEIKKIKENYTYYRLAFIELKARLKLLKLELLGVVNRKDEINTIIKFIDDKTKFKGDL